MSLALLALACTAPRHPPAVVVVVVDTLRADLGWAQAPDWLGEGRRYTRAYSAAPWTSSSTVVLVTGRYPREGLERAHPAGGAPSCDDLERPGLPVLRDWPEDGWPTTVLTDHPVVATIRSAARDTGWTGPGDTSLSSRAVAVLDEDTAGSALYVHTLGAHDPYDGFVDGESVRSSAARVLDKRRWCGTMDEPTAQWARAAYQDGAERALSAVEPVISAALDAGAVVILTADHGEALGEDGRWGHATGLHDAQIHVPLVVWGPGVAPGVDEALVPATCVGQTARLVLGETGNLCDLRTGEIRGEVVAGMLDEQGVWQERVVQP